MEEYEDILGDGILPDGGTQYYWSGEQGILYHSETGKDTVDPFFSSIEQAERYLENQAELHGEKQYENLELRKSGNRKVMEATEVLTSQAGLDQW